MYLLRYSTLLWFLSWCCVESGAQEYRAFARRYGIEEGLPHRQVNSLLQDRQGFIWASTSAGLARFDGRRFKVFNKTESGLGGDIVEWAVEDAGGHIWAHRSGQNGWLNILDPVSGTLIPVDVFFQKQPPPVPHQKWWKAPLLSQDGALFFSLLDDGGFLRYHHDQGWSYMRIQDCKNFLILKVSTRNTVWGLMTKQNGLSTLVEVGMDGTILRQHWPQPGCNFWDLKGGTGSPDGMFLMEVCAEGAESTLEIDAGGNRREAHYPVEKLFVHQRARLENNHIKIQFPYIFDQHDRLLLDISRQYPEIDPAQYRDYLLDRNGNIWFATTFGLIVVELHKSYFRRLLYDENAGGGRGKACRGLLEKNGRLLVNLETHGQGRYRVDPQTGSAERLAGMSGIGIAPSADGNVWTECMTGSNAWQTLSLFKATAEGQLTGLHLLRKKDFGYIWTILEENPQRVLLGHINGMTVYNPLDNTAIPWHDEHFPEFDHANIAWLTKDRRGQIWACTEQGLFQLKPGGGVAARYWSGGKGQYHLPYDNIYHVYEDPDGVFWLGTGGGGLIRWDRQAPPGQQAQVVFRKNGLLNGVVYAAYEDRHEHLWLPTDYGIVQLDKKSLQVRRTWLTTDGLTHNELNRVSHCQGADGTLYFGGLNGVTAFQPDDFYVQSEGAHTGYRLEITGFSVFAAGSGQSENRMAELLQSYRTTVHPGDRYLQLEFALLDYTAPEKVTYTWKLEGITADWETLHEPVLRLSGLPYGARRLRIRAQAGNGAPAVNELDIQLTVLPPVYLRWWFVSGAMLLAVAGIYGWFRWRTREHRRAQERLENEVERQTTTIRRQTEELKKLDQAKSRFFANVSHELRTPLTLMLGPIGSMLKARRLDDRDFSFAKTAHAHGKQLLQLVNEILDLSKMESGKMKLQETAVSIQPFLRRVVSAFESHAERLGILFVFEYRIPERLRLLADEDKLQKVMNNLLSNALKFTPPHSGGSVCVRVEEAGGFIRIGVHDTGRGIHSDDLPHVFERFYQTSQAGAPLEGGTGIGLALCREFAEIMQGRIWVESKFGAGSSFLFEFPKKEVLGVNNDELLMMNDELLMMNDELLMMNDVQNHDRDSSFIINNSSFKKSILLVEDNESLRDYVRSILSEKYHVITAENGQTALKMLNDESGRMNTAADSANPNIHHSPFSIHHSSFIINNSSSFIPHLIISDVMMPAMDGFQLLEALKGDDRWRHIPVVMLTARADMRDKLRALRTGVDDYLLKPFEEDELLARIDNLLKNYAGRSPVQRRPATVARPSSVVTAEDQAWLEAFEVVVEKRLGDFNLTAETLAEDMAMSRAPFFRYLKRLTGLTPAQYLDEARFQKARRLLEHREVSSVKAAAYTVGFRQVKHFSQNYKKRFGKLPSESVA
ncbi:MAG: response regulator [Lewinellaceae bacterium]|nr:response regulator [Lewinellaceae bacterium]